MLVGTVLSHKMNRLRLLAAHKQFPICATIDRILVLKHLLADRLCVDVIVLAALRGPRSCSLEFFVLSGKAAT